MIDVLRRVYRNTLPEHARQFVRRFLREVPIRFGDVGPDIRGRWSDGIPLPPARLRSRVGCDSSRAQFEEIGEKVATSVLELFLSSAMPGQLYSRWLDFGIGCGRIARHILPEPHIEVFTGVDVDSEAIEWCSRNLRGTFLNISPTPPIDLATSSFDVIYCISVFTHLDEAHQDVWLAELSRLLRPGGLFIVSTHPPALVYNRPDLLPSDHEALSRDGFLFVRGSGAFNDDSAFHSRDYVERHWSRHFTIVAYQPGALLSVHDLYALVNTWPNSADLPTHAQAGW